MGTSVRTIVASLLAAVLASTAAVGPVSATVKPSSLTIQVEGALNLPDDDGYNDEAQVRATATSALTVDLELLDADGTLVRSLGAGLPLTDPEADGLYETTAPVLVAGLTAGDHTVRVRRTDAPEITATAGLAVLPRAGAQLTVEAGGPDVYPYADGYRDTVDFTATIASPTSAAFPATGTVKVTSGATVVASWPLSTSDSQTFTWDGTVGGATVAGVYTVTAAVTTADGESLVDSVTVRVIETRLESVSVRRNHDPAPVVDGYRDTVTFTVAGVSSTGATIPVTGTVRLTHKGTTVKTWSLTDSARTTLVWDGRTGGRVVAGSYSVSVIATGPESGSRSSALGFAVSGKGLVRIWGTVREGGSITTRLTDPGWGGTPTGVSTQWMLDGQPIEGATGPRLAVTKAMLGHRVSVQVVADVRGTHRTGTSEAMLVYSGRSSEAYLRGKLNALIRTLPGDYSIQITEADRGKRRIGIDGASEREPASSIKIFIAWAVYRQVDDGVLALTTRLQSGLTVDECLRTMIELSDNLCAIELRHKVGNAYLNRLIDESGYPGTHFWYENGRTKVTSAADLSKLISQVALGKTLSKASAAHFLHLLKTQVWRLAIPMGLAYDVPQASKPGSLWAPGGNVQTDVAFVWGPRSRYSIAVIGYNGADIASIRQISKLAYTYLQGDRRTSFAYQWEQMQATAEVVLRESPSSTGTPLATYPAGTRVHAIDSIRNWYLVHIGGRQGWILNTGIATRNVLL